VNDEGRKMSQIDDWEQPVARCEKCGNPLGQHWRGRPCLNGAFGIDDNGVYKTLPEGGVLRVHERMFNAILTFSISREDYGWEHGW
jgi:hypothetical protein